MVNGTRPELALGRRLMRRLWPAALAIAVIIGVGIPATDFALRRSAFRAGAERMARDLADDLREAISADPSGRDYLPLYVRIVSGVWIERGVAIVRVIDERGDVVAGYGQESERPWWVPTGSAPVVLKSREIGTVEVVLSSTGALRPPALVFVIAAALGLGLGALAYAWPQRLARAMERHAGQLVNDAEQRLTRMRRVAELSHLVNSDLDQAQVLDSVTSAALELLRGDLVRLWLVDEGGETLRVVATKAADGLTPAAPALVLARGRGVVGWVVEHRERRYSASLVDEPLLADTHWVREGAFVSQVTVPLLASDRAVGALVVITRQPRTFTDEELDLLDIFAAKAATAVANARLFAENQRKLAELSVLHEVSGEVTGQLDLQQLGAAVYRHVGRVMDARHLVCGLWNDDTGALQMLYDAIDPQQVGRRIPLRGLVSRVVARGGPIRTNDYVGLCADEGVDAIAGDRLPYFLGVPMLVGGRVVGVLALRTDTRPFTADDERLLLNIARLAALAAGTVAAYGESREQARHLEALLDVARDLSQALDEREVYDAIVRAAADVFGAETGLRIVEGDDLVRVGATEGALAAMPRERLRVGESISGRVAATGALAIVEDAFTDPNLIAQHREHRPDAIRALLCVPVARGGRVLGTLHIYRERGFRFDARAVGLASAFADHAAVAIENSRLHAATVREADKLAGLLRASKTLMGELDLDVVLGRLIDEAGRIAETPHVKVGLVDARGMLRIAALRGAPVPAGFELPIGAGYMGRVAASGEPVFVDDVQADPANPLLERDREQGLRTFLGLPIKAGDEILGVLSFNTEDVRRYRDEEIALLGSFADHAALAVRNSRLHAAAVREAEKLGGLLRASRTIMGELDVDVVLARLIDEAGRIAKTPHVKIYLRDGDRLYVAALRGAPVPPGTEFRVGVSYVGRVAATGEPVFIADTQNAPDNTLRARDREFGIRTFLGLPIRAGDDVLGVLTLNTEVPYVWSEEEMQLLTSFADHAALAVRSSRLYDSLAKRATRLRTLTRLNQLVSSSLDADEVLREINAAAAEMMNAPVSSFWLADEDARMLVPIAFSNPELVGDAPVSNMPYGQGGVGWAAERREPIVIDDVFTDDRYVVFDWFRRAGLKSFFAIPIVLDGTLLAVLAFSGTKPFRLDDEDNDLIKSFVAQAAIAIRNARVYAQSEARRREAEAVADVGRALAQTRDPDAVATRVVEALVTLLDADVGGVFRLDEKSGDLMTLATAGPMAPAAGGIRRLPRGSGLTALVMAEGRPVSSPNTLTDPRMTFTAEQRAVLEHIGARACLGVPLIVQGAVVGVLTVGDRDEREFDAEEIRLAQTFANQAAIALESARLYAETARALGDLRQKNAELDTFVYSVSHDLKAPLVAMEGMASLLLEDYGATLDDDARHYLGRLQANVHQMEQLISDLLALSRIGRESRATEDVGLGDVVGEFVAEQGERLRAAGVKVIVRNDVVLHGVRRQIEQVLMNLLGNAVKYMGDQPAPLIEVGAVPGAGAVELYVRDNGIGIDPAYHDKVFEIFQRLHDVEAEGTGVGLAIVRKIVDAAGGRIWVESAKGAGTTFRFTWPAGREDGGA